MIQSAQTEYLATRTQAIIESVDIIAVDMERKWGIDRLRRLVPLELREKWDRQAKAWNDAIWTRPIHEIEALSHAMIRGYAALDAAATSAGALPIDPIVWEIQRPNGSVVAIVRDNAEAHHVARTQVGRHVEVWTLAEIARVIDAFPQIGQAKEILQGEFIAIRDSPPPFVTDDVSEFV